MRTREFLSKAKEGSKVVLKSNLKDNSIYGGESYLRGEMKGPGSVVTVSKIFNKDADHSQVEFLIEEEGSIWPYYYTPAMVDHIEAGEKEPELSDGMKIAEQEARRFIEIVGYAEALKFVDKLLKVGHVIRMRSNIGTKGSSIDWGCYYYPNLMLGARKTAKIVCVTSDDIGRSKRYQLDRKFGPYYSFPMFDLVYVISRNVDIYRRVEIETTSGKYSLIGKALGNTEKISESKVVDSRKIAYLEKRKYELQIELEMINDMLNKEKA